LKSDRYEYEYKESMRKHEEENEENPFGSVIFKINIADS
jgi:hypothetical protein